MDFSNFLSVQIFFDLQFQMAIFRLGTPQVLGFFFLSFMEDLQELSKATELQPPADHTLSMEAVVLL